MVVSESKLVAAAHMIKLACNREASCAPALNVTLDA